VFCQHLLMPIRSAVSADTNMSVKPKYRPDISARPISIVLRESNCSTVQRVPKTAQMVEQIWSPQRHRRSHKYQQVKLVSTKFYATMKCRELNR